MILHISSTVPQKASDLADMINRVIREGLEGLVLKDVKVSCNTCLFLLEVTEALAVGEGESYVGIFPTQLGQAGPGSENGFVCPVAP